MNKIKYEKQYFVVSKIVFGKKQLVILQDKTLENVYYIGIHSIKEKYPEGELICNRDKLRDLRENLLNKTENGYLECSCYNEILQYVLLENENYQFSMFRNVFNKNIFKRYYRTLEDWIYLTDDKIRQLKIDLWNHLTQNKGENYYVK